MNEPVVIDKIKLNGVVYDSLELVNMIFDEDLTRQHFDIIYTLLSIYNDNGHSLSYKIKIKELLKIYDHKNPRKKGLTEKVKNTAKTLMKLYFFVNNKEKGTYKGYHWVKNVEAPAHPTKDDYIEITLDEDVEQFFTQMKEQNLVMSLKNILSLSTLTQKRIYRWAYAKKGFKNDIPISIDDAKMIFCGRTDIKTVDFIRYYLTQAIEAINERTDLHIDFEVVRADPTYIQKVTSLKFKIKCNYEPKSNRTESQKKSDRERSKKMWETVKEQEEIIELQRNQIDNLYNRLEAVNN